MAASAWILPSWQHTLLLILLLGISLCRALETITSSLPLRDGDVLLSDNRKFALGFFSPGKSTRRYIGTWYNQISEQTVFWVANRDNPINDTSGVLSINSDGALVLYCCSNESLPLWFANVSTNVANNANIAKLQDTGNFILLETFTNRVLWQSFDHPTDTKMPSLKFGLDKATGIDRRLTSWKSKDDPASGNFTQRINTAGYPQEILYKNGAPYWREGPWTGQRWSGMPQMADPFIFNFSYVNDPNEITLTYDIMNSSILARKVLDPSGVVILARWEDSSGQWKQFWTGPVEECDFYGHCGPNSNCNPYYAAKFVCTCLPGFEPKSQPEWLLKDGSGGCIRSNGTSLCQRGDGFIKVSLVKVPDTRQSRVNMSMSLSECEQDCMTDCSCIAYTAADERNGGTGCLKWYGDLWDTRTFSDIGQDLYVRVDAATLAQLTVSKGSTRKWIVGATASAVVALVLLLSIIFVNTRRKRGISGCRSYATPAAAYCRESAFTDTVHDLDEESRKHDLPFYDLNVIVVATDNFSNVNKLGSGGFGSVYKGILDSGKEIAVKRLSTSSGQGIEEFKNEVALIAKLQHRNLVILLGCCIQGNEKMLIYEYMPNKSLDLFLFDEEKKRLLDWGKRFQIAKGIARGILYLHQDSRLRIIHRDLKTSNVLLDASMNPKISDFGLARICGGDQIEGNTRRVAGTYGYMSPEYAMAGKFSIKSDVYSFGVVLLEIISGKSNSSFSNDLVAHVWKLWKDESCLDIADPSMHDMYPDGDILRCIQIGLLCVQEFATDRPTMSAVVSMLENNMSLPSPNSPKQPAFAIEGMSGGEETSSHERTSVNDMSFTAVEGR